MVRCVVPYEKRRPCDARGARRPLRRVTITGENDDTSSDVEARGERVGGRLGGRYPLIRVARVARKRAQSTSLRYRVTPRKTVEKARMPGLSGSRLMPTW